MTQVEKDILKEAICKMLDSGEGFAHIDTIALNDCNDIREGVHGKRRTWEVSIRKVIEIEM